MRMKALIAGFVAAVSLLGALPTFGQSSFTTASGYWSVSNNWSGGMPSTGSNLIFSALNGSVNTNDFSSGASFGWVTVTVPRTPFTLTSRQTDSSAHYYFTRFTNSVPCVTVWDINTVFSNAVTAPVIVDRGTSLTMTGVITNNSGAALYVDTTGTTLVSSVIAGTPGLTKAGVGTLKLTASNAYTGVTTIAEGALVLTDSYASNVANSAGITVYGAGSIGTTGALTQTFLDNWLNGKITAGTVVTGAVVMGANTSSSLVFTNTALSNACVGAAGASATLGAVPVWSDDALRLGGGNAALIYSPAIGGSTNLIVGPVGGNPMSTVILTNNNTTYTGTTTINSGTLQIGNGGTSGTLNPNSTMVINGTLAFNQTDTVTQGTEFNSVLSGLGGLTKAGSGTLILNSTQNSYSGPTTITAGTLKLTNGNDRLPPGGQLTMITPNSDITLDLTGISQTINTFSNIVYNTATTPMGFAVIAGAGGTLTVTNVFALVSAGSGVYPGFNMARLENFIYTNNTGTFSACFSGLGRNLSYYPIYLATNTTIFASSFSLGAGSVIPTTLYLGSNTVINADTVALNMGAGVNVAYTDVTNPKLVLRGTSGGSSRVTAMTVSAVMDLTNKVSGACALDALITALTIANSTSSTRADGIMIMGGGTLDATTVTVAYNSSSGAATGTLAVAGGTVKTASLKLGDRVGAGAMRAMFNLGTTTSSGVLNAQTVTNGAGTAARSFNWVNGTIGNYDADTNLTIATGLTLMLTNAAGTHAFAIDTGRTGLVNAVIAEAEAGCELVKTGEGTLILATNNTYTGVTTVSNGTLLVNGSVTSAVTVATGGTLGGTGTVVGSVTNMGSSVATINGPSGVASLFTVSGALVLQPSSQLVLSSGSDLSTSVSNSYDIIRFTPGLRAGQFGSKNLPSGWTVKYDDAAGYVKVARGSDAGMMLMVQ
jgi:fibronectin-binding autotransporter adhesin